MIDSRLNYDISRSNDSGVVVWLSEMIALLCACLLYESHQEVLKCYVFFDYHRLVISKEQAIELFYTAQAVYIEVL